MNRAELAGGVALAAAGVAVAVRAAGLGLGSFGHPGPGFFSLGLGAALAGLSAVTVARATSADPFPDDERPGAAALARIGGVVAAMAVYTAILPAAGFVVATALLMWALFGLAGGRTLAWQPAAGGAVTAACAWLLFDLMLDVRLPPGSLWGG